MSSPLNLPLGVSVATLIGASIAVGVLYNQVDVLADGSDKTVAKLERHMEPSTHASNQADHEAIIILQSDLKYIQKAVDTNSGKLDEILKAVK